MNIRGVGWGSEFLPEHTPLMEAMPPHASGGTGWYLEGNNHPPIRLPRVRRPVPPQAQDGVWRILLISLCLVLARAQCEQCRTYELNEHGEALLVKAGV
jgi:hypothetical protein